MSRRLTRPRRLGLERECQSEDECTSLTRLRKTISSDALIQDREAISISPTDLRSVGSISSNSSAEKKCVEEPTTLKKRKYFSERNKNIFKKLLHPSYQERNLQYRRLFGHLLDENDLFLISFSCAYQRDILCQGRMYISQKHVCFHANIFGWETRIAVPFHSISSITKERAALIFPNSIQLETDSHEKYFFASFVNRDKTAAALRKVKERVDQNQLISPEEMWEFMNTDRMQGFKAVTKSTSNLAAATPMDVSSPASPSDSPLNMRAARTTDPQPEIEDVTSSSLQDEQQDVTCPCDSHSGKLLLDSVYPLSCEELRKLLFTDSPWFKKFNELLKNTDYHSSPWATDKDGVQNRTCTYSMALNHAMAPKSCVVTEKQIIAQFERLSDGFIVHKETQNSGIPYADHFSIQVRYCVTKVGKNDSRLMIHGGINYKKSIWSMVKGYIEKNTWQGLDDHYSALEATLTAECERREQKRDAEEESESLGSSVEDPTPERVEMQVTSFEPTQRTHHKTHVRDTPRRSIVARSVDIPSMSSGNPDPENYKFYIQIIIVLLAGLLLLNLLLLFRISAIEQQPLSIRQELTEIVNRLSTKSPHAESKVLESLMDALTQSAQELQKLKQQREEL